MHLTIKDVGTLKLSKFFSKTGLKVVSVHDGTNNTLTFSLNL
jgi:hypothetical protein